MRAFVNRCPRSPTIGARSCSTRPTTTRRSRRSASSGARRVVDLWAERSAALGARDDVAYVLVFENRGAEVGATIPHPHGQIYAFDAVPPAPATEARPLSPTRAPPEGDRHVADVGGWRAWVAWASTWPFDLRLAPRRAERPTCRR